MTASTPQKMHFGEFSPDSAVLLWCIVGRHNMCSGAVAGQ
jgi:hypothetical protein